MRISQIIWIAALGCSIGGFSDQKMVYQTMTGSEKTKAGWDVKASEENTVRIRGTSKRGSIEMQCCSDFFLKSYLEKTSEDKSLSIIKEGQVLIVDSKEQGKQKLKSYKIGQTPWVQEFKFGLQSFLRSAQKSFNFYIVNPK